MVKDDDDGGGFTGKRNKSWREIDARRGKSKYHSRQDDPAQQRIERSATYTRTSRPRTRSSPAARFPRAWPRPSTPRASGRRRRKRWPSCASCRTGRPGPRESSSTSRSTRSCPRTRTSSTRCWTTRGSASSGRRWGSSRGCRRPGTLKAKLPKSLDQRLKSLELTSMDPELQQRARALREQLR